MQRTLRLTAVTCLTAAAFLLPGLARGDTLKARSFEGDLFLVSAPNVAASLIRPDGAQVPLALPSTALVNSFTAAGEKWYAAAVDVAAPTPMAGPRRLVVLEGSGSEMKELETPAVLDRAQLREPLLLADSGGLLGLAWIEGKAPRGQMIRLASWTAGGWSEPLTVSPRGPGSQMALSAVVLRDGSFLLAWAAFDGQDDEILWSRWDASGTATRPTRLSEDNAVPDVTPHLWPTPDGGALAAWSRYDGREYRLRLASFDGTSWSRPQAVGPRGSLYPTFQAGLRGEPILLYQQAVPRGWYAAELDDQDRIARLAGVETPRNDRPALTPGPGATLAMVWRDPAGPLAASTVLDWRPAR